MSEPVETDVVVIGCGLAGLVAALRVRRPESVAAFPARVVVFEGERPGGLLNWGGRRAFHVAGPGFRLERAQWERLLRDAGEAGVEIVPEPVVAAALAGPVKEVRGAARTVRAAAAVIASGAFPMRSAAGYRPRDGMFTAFGPLGAVRETLLRLRSRTGRRRLALFGPPGILELARLLAELEPVVLVEPPYDGPLPVGARVGTLIRIVGEPGVEGLLYRTPAGRVEQLPCDCVYPDFNAYMERTGATAFLAGSGLTLRNGFVAVDAAQATHLPGVFAAGDVTGGMFSVSKALHEGNRAGFSALLHVHRTRLGFEPSFYPFFHGPFGTELGVFHRRPRVGFAVAGVGDAAVLEVSLPGAAPLRYPLGPAHEAAARALTGRDGTFRAEDLVPGDQVGFALALLFELVRVQALGVGRASAD